MSVPGAEGHHGGHLGQAESNRQAGAVTETARVVDRAAERSLCFKFDVRILPVLAVMYLFNALDKGNLSNAQTNGLGRDLGFKDGQYNLVVSIFFVPFVLFAPPLAMLSKKLGPARSLPVMMFAFGSMTLLTAATRSFGGLFAVRWFLGMAEAAFFPVVIYYLTTFYRRGELARRLAVFYAASNLASGFSGLLAFGVFHIRSELQAWRYLFLISPMRTALAFHRIQVDSSSIVAEDFNLGDSLSIFTYPSSFAFLAIEMCLGVPLQSVALFLPQMVQRLGYSAVLTNLYTVAPSATGAVMLLILAFCSDLTRLRFPFIVLGYVFTFVGFVIYASIDRVETQLRLAYSATFIMCWGTSAPSVILSTWYNNNVAHEGRRVTLTSVGVPLANAMGLVASNVFRDADAPKYLPALVTAASFGAAGALITAGLGVYMMFDNKRRDRRAGVHIDARDIPTQRLRNGPSVDEFRWFL
ncbi:Major facilitator superfamily transporter [Ophiocordyceps sinensis CO18]|uniref:Major facilitator superfamily transporter n=1 Tax=Ophiocordyceps sinensis (strain Co18 / CGMCC 3.14243) TaxID=911162 RepID=T5AK06_OPHSC|nr:Major facilitator superfamily transporter [Ophiocordyceps sinensis CO18]